jgi:hypothetical protein
MRKGNKFNAVHIHTITNILGQPLARPDSYHKYAPFTYVKESSNIVFANNMWGDWSLDKRELEFIRIERK